MPVHDAGKGGERRPTDEVKYGINYDELNFNRDKASEIELVREIIGKKTYRFKNED